jgi:YbgC/YbaW family acyl-CoA thioester hydrolase
VHSEEYFSTEIEVTDAEVDPLYHHVHHASVVEFLELARLRLLESKGVPQNSWIDQGLLIVVTRLQVQFRGELHKGTYQVLCFLPEIHSRKILIGQGIASTDGQLAVEAQVELMFMDSNKRTVVSPPRRFIEAFLRVQ